MPYWIEGVSWVQLPNEPPPYGEVASARLIAQGAVALQVGEQRWFAPGVTGLVFPGGSEMGGGKKRRDVDGGGRRRGLDGWGSRRRRDLDEGNKQMKRGVFRGDVKGTIYIGPPRRWRYPDLITEEGKEYRSSNRNDTEALVFRSAGGEVFDISRLGEWRRD